VYGGKGGTLGVQANNPDACPNEVTAVKVAMALRDRGFHRVRPLASGIDAWVAAGQGIETA